ncbi:MAG: LysE family transporter [Candidatus Methanofastidiosia archaeon]
MELAAFIASVVFISISGVLAPGPLLAATIAEGKVNKYAGFLISIGHAAVEIPIIIALFAFGSIVANESIKSAVGLIGGIVLLYMAYREVKFQEEVKPVRGILMGVMMSSLNPYFIVWWLTIGFRLTIQAAEFGLIGFVLFVIVHELCDFTWLGFVSVTSNKTAKMIEGSAEKILTAVSVSILLIFGTYFIYDGIKILL